MAFAADSTISVGGVAFYPFQSIPMEANGTDSRQLGSPVTITTAAGGAVVLRDPDTTDVISSTLTSSAVNGVVQAFYADAPVVKYVSGGSTLLVQSLGVTVSQAEIDDALARAEGAENSAAQTLAANQALVASNAVLEQRLNAALAQIEGGGVVGGVAYKVVATEAEGLAEPLNTLVLVEATA